MRRVLLFFLLFSSFANAINVYWEPKEPRVGDVVTVYAEIENVSSATEVKLKYCPSEEICFYECMNYESGKWFSSFNATEKGNVDIAIIVDGKVIIEDVISVKGKSIASFEIVLVVIVIFVMTKIKMKK